MPFKKILAESSLVVFGLFLIIDDIFLGLIIFSYPEAIKFLDPYIGHWIWGVVLILIAVFIYLKIGE